MCGISGFITSENHNLTNSEIKNIVHVAQTTQSNRGPDNFGAYIDNKKNICLFHNRLSLVDLSPKGNQPMEKHGLKITFNGEIYNFREIRDELVKKGYDFFSTSDTEVILSAYDAWGENALKKFNGAYAFALHDSNKNLVLLARDKVGEKPLFYFKDKNGVFYFASSIKFLKEASKSSFSLNDERFISDLIFNFWSDKSATHYSEINMLEPGCLLILDNNLKSTCKRYWDLPTMEIESSENEILTNIEQIIKDSIEIRASLDTKICSVLSGGIDSSFICALAQKHLDYPLSTFTLEKFGYVDEDLASARKISQEYGWKNNSVKIRKSDISEHKIIDVTKAMEEPILDQVYIYINRNYEEIHSQKLKAVLNGQGSDEIFLGYLDYYPFLKNQSNYLDLLSFKEFWYDNFVLKDYIHKDIVLDSIEKNLRKNYTPYVSDDLLNNVLRFGVKTHMPALLIQEDKQSMAWSVECRTVYTDHRLVEYLSKIPSKIKYLDGKEKYLLRTVAKKYLPDYITNRKKLGFPNLPDGRDLLINQLISKERLPQSSELLNRLFFPTLFKNLEMLPLGMKWKLCAIATFEKQNLISA